MFCLTTEMDMGPPAVLKCNSSCSSVIVKKNKTIILSYVGENVSARNLLVHIHVQFDKT